MANAQTEIKQIEFLIKEEQTVCNIFYTSNEPGTPWGGGWKTKTFPASKNVVQILQENVPEYIMWNNGRDSIND